MKKIFAKIIVFFFLILIVVLILIKHENHQSNNKIKILNRDKNIRFETSNDELIDNDMTKLNIQITNSFEKNDEIVEKYFVDGMDVNDYQNTLTSLGTYVLTSGKYEQLSYNFEKHYRYSFFENLFKNLSKSDIVKLEIIGKSVDGRNLYALEIGTGEDVTLFEAGIHASEIASPLFITKFMIDLVNKYEKGDKDTIQLLKNNKIVVLPFANPDGYEASIFGTEVIHNKDLFINEYSNEELKMFKSNANGVDLNRNFPSQTAGLYYNFYDLHYSVSLVKSTYPYDYYPGEVLGSEPEIRAIMYLQNKWIKQLKSYVALHSAGRSIYNGKPYLSDEYNNNSYACGEIVKDITGYTLLSKLDELAGEGNDGTSSEYMAESLSGFMFSSKTGRLSSDYYAKYYDELKYKGTCVIVIESLERYTENLDIIKSEYYDYNLEKAYLKVIQRSIFEKYENNKVI